MVESRWLRWFGPGLAAVGAVAFIASTTLGAGRQPWSPRTCAGPPSERVTAIRSPGSTGFDALRAAPWFRLDPSIDAGGNLIGQRLAIGVDGDRSSRILDLTPESFATGPFGRSVLVGSDDGSSSRLDAYDVTIRCSWPVAVERDVIRRATVDPTGTTIYEMRVDRRTRADLGIWRRPTDGTTAARRVLPPIGPDERFGRTFSTEFVWDLAGDRLAIQSCGEVACRTRVLVPAEDDVMTLDAPDLGLLIGLHRDTVITHAACPGLPCAIVASDIRDGTRQVLAEEAGLATLVTTPDGPRVVHETAFATGRVLRSIPLDGRAATDLGPIPDDLRLVPGPSRAEAATRVPGGWVVLAPEGRIPAGPIDAGLLIRDGRDGTTVQFEEALR